MRTQLFSGRWIQRTCHAAGEKLDSSWIHVFYSWWFPVEGAISLHTERTYDARVHAHARVSHVSALCNVFAPKVAISIRLHSGHVRNINEEKSGELLVQMLS